MEPNATLRIELTAFAGKLLSQLHIENSNIEEQIKKGLELAIDDICKEDNLVNYIRTVAKDEIHQMIRREVFSWELKNRIRDLISSKMEAKLQEFSDKMTDKVINALTYEQ